MGIPGNPLLSPAKTQLGGLGHGTRAAWVTNLQLHACVGRIFISVWFTTPYSS